MNKSIKFIIIFKDNLEIIKFINTINIMELHGFDYHFQEESQGKNTDLTLFKEENWLGQSIVGYLVEPKPENWQISLVFVSNETPLKFMIRKLENSPSLAKAQQYKLLSEKTAKILKNSYQRLLN
jgi:hypothetical protein